MNRPENAGAPGTRGLCSVVVPAYNAAAFIGDTLCSLGKQTYQDWEAIVIDDGSTDDTVAVVEAANNERIRLLRQPHGGVSAARSRGMEAARGVFLLFLDADDWLWPNALTRFIAALHAAPEACAAYGEGVLVGELGNDIGVRKGPFFSPRPSGDVLEALLQRNFILTPGVLCTRTELARAAGAWRCDLRVAEDWEYWCRLALLGSFVYIGHEPVLKYRVHPDSVVRAEPEVAEWTLKNVAAVYANPDVVARFPADRLACLRRRCEAWVYSFAGTKELRVRNWRAARQSFGAALWRNPTRPREWILLLLSLLHCLPAAVERRLK